MDIVTTESNRAGLEINQKKSFTQAISKKKVVPKCSIKEEGAIIKQVDNFTYLGSLITSNGKSDKEILRRISIAKAAFISMASTLTSKGIKMQTRFRTLKFYVCNAPLYGCQTWTSRKAMEKRLVATEVWFLRRILRVPWLKRISNEILRKAQTSMKLIKTIHERQFRFFGHVMRKKKN